MQPARYRVPGGNEEFALSCDASRKHRLLVVPALFDEANKLRRFTVEVMRRLDGAGVDTFLPDLPGCHESLAPLKDQTLALWRHALEEAAAQFGATHVLSIRAGAVIAPPSLPGWRYAPTGGSNILRGLIRARLVGASEAGRDESSEGLLEQGRSAGIELAGYQLGAAMVTGLEQSRLPDNGRQQDIPQATLGGPGLWLRAEPDDNDEQADALAAMVAMAVGQ